MFLRLNNLFVTVKTIQKKQRPSVRRQFVFIFYNFLSMSRLKIFNKVFGQSIFRGATRRSLVTVMFHYTPIAAIFWHFLKIVLNYLGGGALCHGPTLPNLLQKSETDSKGRLFFRSLCFWDEKSTKLGQSQNEDFF